MAGQEPANAGGTVSRQRFTRYLWLLLIAVIAAASILGSAYLFHWFGPSPLTCGTLTGNVPRYFHFTVVMSLNGYNDSRNHPLPWPKMNMTINWEVVIHVWNNDTGQAHGLAITHYFDQGVSLRPGQSCDLAFFANQPGTFSVYNTVLDTIDYYENAELNVNP